MTAVVAAAVAAMSDRRIVRDRHGRRCWVMLSQRSRWYTSGGGISSMRMRMMHMMRMSIGALMNEFIHGGLFLP